MAVTEAALSHGGCVRPCQGEDVSGDVYVVRDLENALFVAIVDVLGHGPEAHELARLIDAYLTRYGSADVAGLVQRLHQHLKGTRGAAAGLCAVHAGNGRVDYVGVGNTVLRRFGDRETRLVSRDGVLGHTMRTPLQQTLDLSPGDVLVFYTDGVSDRFTIDAYPGILHHPPADIAHNVVARFGKNFDDATCVAVRYQP
jgi:serine phosphatase RsbU (regulator of sigma subunit)